MPSEAGLSRNTSVYEPVCAVLMAPKPALGARTLQGSTSGIGVTGVHTAPVDPVEELVLLVVVELLVVDVPLVELVVLDEVVDEAALEELVVVELVVLE